MKVFSLNNLLISLFLTGVLVLSGCVSFPQSKNADDSLLIIILHSDSSSKDRSAAFVKILRFELSGSAGKSKVKKGDDFIVIPVKRGSFLLKGVTFSDGSENNFPGFTILRLSRLPLPFSPFLSVNLFREKGISQFLKR